MLDKWFAVQARATRPDSVETVQGAALAPQILAEEPEPRPRPDRQLRPRQSDRLQPRRWRRLRVPGELGARRSTASTRIWRRACSARSKAGARLSQAARLWPRAPCGSSPRANCPQTATKLSQKPSAPTDSTIRQSVINQFSTIFPWTVRNSDSFNRERFGDAAVLRLEQENHPLRGTECRGSSSAQQPLFAIAAPIWHGLRESLRPLSAQDRAAPPHGSRSHRHLRLARGHRPRHPDRFSRGNQPSRSPKSGLRSWPTCRAPPQGRGAEARRRLARRACREPA